jgi:hypothetical protein
MGLRPANADEKHVGGFFREAVAAARIVEHRSPRVSVYRGLSRDQRKRCSNAG